MTSRDVEELAAQVLTWLGLEVEAVPVTDRKTPDRRASDPQGGRYTIEVKARFDERDFDAAIGRQGFAMGDVELGDSPSVANTVKHASRQVASYSEAAPPDPGLIFYVLAGGAFSTSLHAEQIWATLFGAVLVSDPFDWGFGAVPCFYLGRSALRDYPNVEGVLLLDPVLRRLVLYPNRFAGRDTRKTYLGAKLAALNAVFSPEDAAAKGAGLICDAPSSATFRERLRFVQAKYGRRFSPMRSADWRAEMRV